MTIEGVQIGQGFDFAPHLVAWLPSVQLWVVALAALRVSQEPKNQTLTRYSSNTQGSILNIIFTLLFYQHNIDSFKSSLTHSPLQTPYGAVLVTVIQRNTGGTIVKICKVHQTTCTARLLKQGYFLYLCTPVHHLIPQLTVCEFQMASVGNELRSLVAYDIVEYVLNCKVYRILHYSYSYVL